MSFDPERAHGENEAEGAEHDAERHREVARSHAAGRAHRITARHENGDCREGNKHNARPEVLGSADGHQEDIGLSALSNRAELRSDCRYSGLILPSAITVFHLSKSLFRNASPSCGLLPRGSTPTLANAALTSSFASVFLMSALSRLRTSAGNPAGAKMPSQRSTSKPFSPASSTVGKSG